MQYNWMAYYLKSLRISALRGMKDSIYQLFQEGKQNFLSAGNNNNNNKKRRKSSAKPDRRLTSNEIVNDMLFSDTNNNNGSNNLTTMNNEDVLSRSFYTEEEAADEKLDDRMWVEFHEFISKLRIIIPKPFTSEEIMTNHSIL